VAPKERQEQWSNSSNNSNYLTADRSSHNGGVQARVEVAVKNCLLLGS